MSLSRDLEGPGELDSTITYTFDFGQADKRYESYFGSNIRLRYFLRITILRSLKVNIMEEHDFLVHVVESAPASNPPIRCSFPLCLNCCRLFSVSVWRWV